MGVGCDCDGQVFVAIGNSIFQLRVPESSLELVRTFPNTTPNFQVDTICFDKTNKFYITSNEFGLQIFSNIRSNQIEVQWADWRGPINLSHPSNSIIGVDYSKQEFGQLYVLTWINNDLQKKEISAWDATSWMCNVLSRNPIFQLRRSWYSDRIMWYFIDKASYEFPEDGIRSLHMMYGPDKSIQQYLHTFMSCPWDTDGFPFAIEIPHAINYSGELFLFTQRGICTERGQIVFSFPNQRSDKNVKRMYSTSDYEGAGSSRTRYVVGWCNSDDENYVYVIDVLK